MRLCKKAETILRFSGKETPGFSERTELLKDIAAIIAVTRTRRIEHALRSDQGLPVDRLIVESVPVLPVPPFFAR